MTLITKSDYAALHGWSRAYLSKESVAEKLKPAMEPDPKKPSRMLVNVEKADEIFRTTSDPSRYLSKPEAPTPAAAAAAVPAPAEDSFSSVKRNLTQTQLERAQLDLADRKGQLINRAEVFQAAAAAGQSIREQLKTLSRNISEKAAPMTDAIAIKAMVDAEIRAILEIVSHDFERALQTANGKGGDTAH